MESELKRRWCRALLCLAAVASCAAVGSQSKALLQKEARSLEGEVAAGPCSQALILLTATGQKVELDRARVMVREGERGRFEGVLYPRVSVCRHFPWFDVEHFVPGAVKRTAVAARPVAQGEPSSSQEHAGELLIVTNPDDLRSSLLSARKVRPHVPIEGVVTIGLKGSYRDLARVLRAAVGEDFDLLSGVRVTLVELSTPLGVVWRDRSYPNIDAFLEAQRGN